MVNDGVFQLTPDFVVFGHTSWDEGARVRKGQWLQRLKGDDGSRLWKKAHSRLQRGHAAPDSHTHTHTHTNLPPRMELLSRHLRPCVGARMIDRRVLLT